MSGLGCIEIESCKRFGRPEMSKIYGFFCYGKIEGNLWRRMVVNSTFYHFSAAGIARKFGSSEGVKEFLFIERNEAKEKEMEE